MKIAVFLPNWIGDVVMATPALRALREHFRDAQLVGVMRPYVADVLRASPWLDGHIFLDKKGPWSSRWFAVSWKMRREAFDLAVLFPNSFHTALVAWLGGCRRLTGYRRYGRGWLLTTALEPVRDAMGRLKPSPAIDAFNLLAQAVGCPSPGYRMELFTTPEDEATADVVWHKAGLGHYSEVVCLSPGGAFGSAKHWSVEYFARLAQRLVDRRGSGVLVLCGPSEIEQANQIAQMAQRSAVHSLANVSTVSLGLTKACVRRADLLVATDSGPRHFAAAFDRPVVTLFGPTHIPWTETYFPKAVHKQKEVPCGPCQLRVCPLDHRCMKELTPEEVFAAADALLQRYPRQRKAS